MCDSGCRGPRREGTGRLLVVVLLLLYSKQCHAAVVVGDESCCCRVASWWRERVGLNASRRDCFLSSAAMPSNSSPLHSHLATLPEYSTPRAQFLYSSLPPRRTANPTGYSGAIQWWRRTFVDLVSKGLLGHDKLILDAKDDLREQLRWQKIGRPLSLGTVIVRFNRVLLTTLLGPDLYIAQAELATSGDYVRLEDYLAGGGGEAGRSSWGSLLARPLWWGYSKVFGSSEAGEGADEKEWIARKGDWVIKELVEVCLPCL